MKYLILLLSISIIFCGNVNSQAKVEEEDLSTTFSKYFGDIKAVNNTSNTDTLKVVNDYNYNMNSFYSSTIDGIIAIGKTFIGIPYRWGGVNEYGFDCSGFVKYIFNWFGYNLPRTSREMANYGEYVPKSDLQRGDLVFFTGRNSRSGTVGHIGIIVDVKGDKINMMHSSSSKGVHIEDLNQSSYFTRRYLTARRLQIDKNNYKVH